MSLLEIRDLHLGLHTGAGVVHALRGVDLAVASGEVVAVVGESGCGKTVTMQTVMGLLPADEIAYRRGQVRFEGRDLLGLSERDWRRVRGAEISMVFQDPLTTLNPTRTVESQVVEAVQAHGAVAASRARRRTRELLAQVGIPAPEFVARRYPFQLSGGMRQRILIAAALAGNPRLLIADEPTTALDVTIQAQILALLQSLRRRYEMAIVLVTHNLGVVAEMADRVAVMYAGRVVEEGPAHQILSSPAHPYTQGLLEGIPRLDRTREEKLLPIRGAPPILLTEPAGCAFMDRCTHAMGICAAFSPPMFPAAPAQRSACFLHHPAAAAGSQRTAQPAE